MVEKRTAYRILIGKTPIARPRHRWEDNNKMDLSESGWGVIRFRIGTSGRLL
jgi:hypothetical protein